MNLQKLIVNSSVPMNQRDFTWPCLFGFDHSGGKKAFLAVNRRKAAFLNPQKQICEAFSL